jgi:hypothetical protein
MAVGTILRGTGMLQERVPTLTGTMTRETIRDTLNHVADGASFEGWTRGPEQIAREMLADAGHDPDRPGLMPTPVADGSSLAAAHAILRWIRIARAEIRNGNSAAATYAGIQIGCLVREHDLNFDWGRAALRGQPFIEGPKAKRADALARLIRRAFEELEPKATAKAILDYIQTQTDVVQEVDDDGTIYWRNRSSEKKTSFKAFSNRVAEQRKRFSRPNGAK